MITVEGEWDYVELKRWLPENIINVFRNTLPPNSLDGIDKKMWESQLISRIRAWIQKDWSVSFNHTFKEGNACADWMKNFILENDEGVQYLFCDEPPPGIHVIYLADLTGVERLRALVIQ
ncbi:uncharacterized protein LOC133313381 [Gastrolobium bilobum]|uniref:uncharacterized protein LOC133313381 n=1 Tax=Gastrolobium bilobum TaxID=150636 RepID=UPI002AAFFA9D|nr:uncharacterized protein LOC133313381 [Gastrolobium bilobum]